MAEPYLRTGYRPVHTLLFSSSYLAIVFVIHVDFKYSALQLPEKIPDLTFVCIYIHYILLPVIIMYVYNSLFFTH